MKIGSVVGASGHSEDSTVTAISSADDGIGVDVGGDGSVGRREARAADGVAVLDHPQLVDVLGARDRAGPFPTRERRAHRACTPWPAPRVAPSKGTIVSGTGTPPGRVASTIARTSATAAATPKAACQRPRRRVPPGRDLIDRSRRRVRSERCGSGEDPIRHVSVHRARIERERQHPGDLGVFGFEPATLVAVAVGRELSFEAGGVILVQAVERPDRQELVDQRMVAGHGATSPICERSRRMASSVRDLTVPSGSPVRSAICDCDMPSKYIRWITSRCSSGSSASAFRMRRRSRGRSIADKTSSVGSSTTGGPSAAACVRAAALRLLSSHCVDGTVVDGPHQPRADGTSRSVVPIGVPPDGEERFLHDLLRDLRMTDQPEGERVRHGCVSSEELAERVLVAAGDPQEQVFVPRLGLLSGAHRVRSASFPGSSMRSWVPSSWRSG